MAVLYSTPCKLKKKKRVKEGRKEGKFFFPKWPEMIVIKMLEQYYFKKDCAWAGAK